MSKAVRLRVRRRTQPRPATMVGTSAVGQDESEHLQDATHNKR
jgi:hypothetical protein